VTNLWWPVSDPVQVAPSPGHLDIGLVDEPPEGRGPGPSGRLKKSVPLRSRPARLARTIRAVGRVEEIDEKRGVALKRGTMDVPNDGRYHVLVDGEIVLSTRVEAAARIEFQNWREERMTAGRTRLATESAHRDARQFKNDVLKTKASNKVKQGARPKH